MCFRETINDPKTTQRFDVGDTVIIFTRLNIDSTWFILLDENYEGHTAGLAGPVLSGVVR